MPQWGRARADLLSPEFHVCIVALNAKSLSLFIAKKGEDNEKVNIRDWAWDAACSLQYVRLAPAVSVGRQAIW